MLKPVLGPIHYQPKFFTESPVW